MAAADTAFRLIVKKGRLDGALRRPGADAIVTDGRPWAPTDANPGEVPLIAGSLPILVIDMANLPEKSAQSLAPEATAMGLLPALALTGLSPQIGDLLETGGDRYAILRVDRLDESTDKVLYTLSLKAR